MAKMTNAGGACPETFDDDFEDIGMTCKRFGIVFVDYVPSGAYPSSRLLVFGTPGIRDAIKRDGL
jgi:hypothetical protein